MKENINKILDFYMLANNLKFITYKKDRTVANKIYNYIILAYAINSEYDVTDNIGETIKKIIIDSIKEYNTETLLKNDIFIDSVKLLEKSLSNIIDNYIYTNLKEKDIRYLYKKIHEDSFVPKTNYENNYNIFRFYILNTILNKKERSGWDQTHWNVKSERIEKVSEHIIGVIALAIAINEYVDIDINKVIEMLTIHEIGEILIGDITPFDKITEEEKKEIEHKAMKDVLGNLKNADEAFKLLEEFDSGSTKEARFAYLCDKLEADIQAKVYQDKGMQNSLKKQYDNVVFKSKKIQEMINSGAKTAFDIWYLYDKDKFTNDPVFIKTLQYVKNNKLI